MKKTLVGLLAVALLVAVAPATQAATVANGSILDISDVAAIGVFGPFPPAGTYTIDNNGKLTLNVKLPACPSTLVTVVFSCANDLIFDGLFGIANFTTDATGKFVGAFPGAYNGLQGQCMDPLFIVSDAASFSDLFSGTFTCLGVNGF